MDLSAAFCLVDRSIARKNLDEGAEVLRELRRRYAENPWIWWASGYLEVHRDPSQSDSFFERSLELAVDQGDLYCELVTLEQLLRRHYSKGSLGEAELLLRRVKTIAHDSDDELLMAWSKVIRGRHLWRQQRNVAEAITLIRQAEPVVRESGPYLLRRRCLTLLANISQDRSEFSAAAEYFEELEELAVSASREVDRAMVLYHRAALEENRASAYGIDTDIVSMYEEALAAAEAAGSSFVALWSHAALGDLLAAKGGSLSAAEQHYRSCDRLAAKLDDPQARLGCYLPLVSLLVRTNPKAAHAVLDESDALARALNDPFQEAVFKGLRIHASWAAGSRDLAIEQSLAALDALEAMRSRERQAAGRAAVFAQWTEAYQIVAGYLLGGPDGIPIPDDVDLAFETIERMRSRVLLDRLTGLPADLESSQGEELRVRLSGVRRDMARARRRLLDLDLPEAERKKARERLERLEISEASAYHELAVDAPEVEQEFVSLAQVSSELGRSEALLSFQISDWLDHGGYFAGGAWLYVATRAGTKVYPLPGRHRLVPAIEMHHGFFEYRDGSERSTAASLYQMLLAEAVEDLPSEIDRLILVPDGVLHLLPFASLRPAVDAPSLVERFDLVIEPSATLWWRWRQRSAGGAGTAVLALADPAVGADAEGRRLLRVGLPTGEPLERLRHARREGREAVRASTGPGKLLAGPQASERALRDLDLTPYSVLHFAAHTLIDGERPARSAVLLAPGAQDEDGWLLAREIAALELTGKVVVLSMCQSAAGRVLQGEGVMSPARAFFEAGAEAVVGTLWRLRDRDAAELFTAFYERLAQGQDVAAALAGAQRERIRAGAPAQAWAGVTVIGGGHLRPLPAQEGFAGSVLWSSLAPMLVMVAVAALLVILILRAWLRSPRRGRQRAAVSPRDPLPPYAPPGARPPNRPSSRG